jgi:citrate synthase
MKKINNVNVFTLTADEVCDQLGISPQTLYSYVSRGIVRAIEHPDDSRKSLYDYRDIETLSERKKRGRSRSGIAKSTINWGEPIMCSSVSSIVDEQLFYRGNDAIELSETASLEDVALLLTSIEKVDPIETIVSKCDMNLSAFSRVLALMSQEAIRIGVNPVDPDYQANLLRQSALLMAGKNNESNETRKLYIHQLLAKAWNVESHSVELIRRALVLCADHELNPSTYVTRITASTWANLPSCLLSGLAALSGARHAGLTARCLAWMEEISVLSHDNLIQKLSALEGLPPGFGHPLYPSGDPRAKALMGDFVLPNGWQQCRDLVEERLGVEPNIDFALAALEKSISLPKGSSLAIFAMGRMVGWIAHIEEQQTLGQLIRPRAF